MAIEINKGKALDSMNLTSLIDVVFLLLIFFLVSTRFAEEEYELKIAAPAASEAKPLTMMPTDLTVNITASGQYFVSGEVLDEEGLELAMRQAVRDNPTRKAVIRADENAKSKYTIAAANLCVKTGIHKYTVVTKKSN